MYFDFFYETEYKTNSDSKNCDVCRKACVSNEYKKKFKECVWKICLLLFEHNLFPFFTGKISNIRSADTYFLSSSFLYVGHFCSIAEFDSESRTVIWYPVRASC